MAISSITHSKKFQKITTHQNDFLSLPKKFCLLVLLATTQVQASADKNKQQAIVSGSSAPSSSSSKVVGYVDWANYGM